MDQLLDKETATRREPDVFSSSPALSPQAALSSRRESEPLASQSLFGNAAVAASPNLASQPPAALTLQSTFGNAAVTQSAVAGPILTQSQAQITAQPAASITT